MSARRSSKQKLGPFVPLLKDTLDAPSWRALSHGARSLYIALKRRHNPNSHTNGRLYLSQRDAVKEIRSSFEEITDWYRELQHYGFIVMVQPGCLGVYGKGKAPHWRLTELGYMHDPPTRDFLKWNGTKFKRHKRTRTATEIRSTCESESRSGNPVHPATEIRSTSATDFRSGDGNNCYGNPVHTAAPRRCGNPVHTKLTTGGDEVDGFADPRRTPWPEQRIRLLREMIDEGLSAAQIGATLGLTRSAVLGKANRLGLSVNGSKKG